MPAEQLPTYARFYEHSTLMGDPAPQLNNPPVYHDVVMAEIFIKGDKNTSHSKLATDKLKEMYPVAWKAYQEGSDDYSEGTPLKALPKMGVSAIRNLQTQGIMSVEDLAYLSDSVVIGNPGMQELRKNAKSFLDYMEPGKVQAEKDAQKEEMDGLREQLAEMKALLQSKPKRTRRKRNAEGVLE